MHDAGAGQQVAPTREAAGGVRTLVLHLFVSLLFCLALGLVAPFSYEIYEDVTYDQRTGSLAMFGVLWIVFAGLQIRWWAKGHEKFWRPVYAWALLGFMFISLIFLPALLWPRFRHWLFRSLKPDDPPATALPGRDPSVRTLEQLRDEGIVTEAELGAKVTTRQAPVPRPSERGSARHLALHLFLSLVFCLAMGQAILFGSTLTTEEWATWTVAWGVIWIVFAVLQTIWWTRGYEKFWRPLYAWTLFGLIVISLIFLPFLLWTPFRRWLLRVIKPTDPPDWDTTLRTLARRRDEGSITAEDFDAKKQELLRQA